jgi:hypothetical protein
MCSVGFTTRLRLAADVRFRRVGDEGAVVRQRVGEVLIVNDSATTLLEVAAQRGDVASAARILSGAYDVDAEVAASQLVTFARTLVAEGILEVDAADVVGA